MNNRKHIYKVKVAIEIIGISSHPGNEHQIRKTVSFVNARYNVLRVLNPDLTDRQILSLLSIDCILNRPQPYSPSALHRFKRTILLWFNRLSS